MAGVETRGGLSTTEAKPAQFDRLAYSVGLMEEALGKDSELSREFDRSLGKNIIHHYKYEIIRTASGFELCYIESDSNGKVYQQWRVEIRSNGQLLDLEIYHDKTHGNNPDERVEAYRRLCLEAGKDEDDLGVINSLSMLVGDLHEGRQAQAVAQQTAEMADGEKG